MFNIAGVSDARLKSYRAVMAEESYRTHGSNKEPAQVMIRLLGVHRSKGPGTSQP